METHVSGQHGITSASAPTSNAYYVGTLRRNILACVVGNELFTDEEQLQTNHSVHECGCAQRLALWLKNVRRVAGEREQAQALASMAAGIAKFEAKLSTAAPAYATPAQCDALHQLAQHPAATPAEKAQILLLLPSYTESEAHVAIARQQAALDRRSGVVVPATDKQKQRVADLLNGPRFSAVHREYYLPKLPLLSWVDAANIINQLRRTRRPVLDAAPLGCCPQGELGKREYAANVLLTRTQPGDSGGRYRRAQPGEAFHLCYFQN